MTSKHTRHGTLIWAAPALVFLSCMPMHPNVARRDAAWMVYRAEGRQAAEAKCASLGLEAACYDGPGFDRHIDRAVRR